MERLDPLEAAQHIVSERFPDATAAFLTGSALSTRRTITSDLDIVIVLKDNPAPFRETIREHGWMIELFVQTLASIKFFSDLEAADHRATTLQMIADGRILRSVDEAAEHIQSDAIERLSKGPSPITAEEMLRRRYMLTDQLDDFIGATDQSELFYIAEQLVLGTSELALLSKSKWLATGKWLPRHLEVSDSTLSSRLVEATKAVLVHGDKLSLEVVVREILERVGGPFSEGYHVSGEILG
ncbi:MAG: nucleotidyltransferase domain-containing protein [Candidatus Nanopelagicaceae bacterium]|jgi:hypothetical protein